MKTLSEALKGAGISTTYALTAHAKERLRQRLGLQSEEAMVAWITETIPKASSQKRDGNKTHYITDTFEIVCDGIKVVTVKPADTANEYLTKIGGVLTKEISKLLTLRGRELRKAEIAVAEAQLNLLKARSPKIKTIIQAKLTDAIDYKASVEDEITQIRKAAERYGVSV